MKNQSICNVDSEFLKYLDEYRRKLGIQFGGRRISRNLASRYLLQKLKGKEGDDYNFKF